VSSAVEGSKDGKLGKGDEGNEGDELLGTPSPPIPLELPRP
jgi:hypothetical protein